MFSRWRNTDIVIVNHEISFGEPVSDTRNNTRPARRLHKTGIELQQMKDESIVMYHGGALQLLSFLIVIQNYRKLHFTSYSLHLSISAMDSWGAPVQWRRMRGSGRRSKGRRCRWRHQRGSFRLRGTCVGSHGRRCVRCQPDTKIAGALVHGWACQTQLTTMDLKPWQ